MRIELVPQQIWIDVETFSLNLSEYPPSLSIDFTLNHIYNDRISFIYINLLKLTYVGSINIRIHSEPLLIIFDRDNKSLKFSREFLVDMNLLQLIENERQKNQQEDLNFLLTIEYQLYQSLLNGQLYTSSPTRLKQQLRLSLSEWKKALGPIKYQLVPLSNAVVNELEALRKKWSFWTIENVITKFLESYKGEKVEISQQFLVTFPETKTIRDKFKELAEKSTSFKEVRVISLYLDGTAVDDILTMLKNKVDVKLITRKPDKKAHKVALSTLKENGAKIKTDGMMHSRMIIFDDQEAIISSADLDSEGLNNQKQAGIFTTDKSIVKDAIVFFNKAWESAEKYSS